MARGADNRIAELRRARGWSQGELADKLNTTAVSVGRYESGGRGLTLPLMRRIAKALGVTVGELIGADAMFAGQLAVPVYDIRASAGAGALVEDGPPDSHQLFPESWLRARARDTSKLVIVQVSGDSMWDTLHDGDHTLIDMGQVNPRHEGLYVLRIDEVLQVKRISMHPVSKLLTIKSDNPNYPTYADVPPDDIVLVGRVVWIGRNLG